MRRGAIGLGIILGITLLPISAMAADPPSTGLQYCSGCGCKGGPGYRKPDGACANRTDMSSGVCGLAPAYAGCKRENTPPRGSTPGPGPAAAGTVSL
jgi:hypothetical protein